MPNNFLEVADRQMEAIRIDMQSSMRQEYSHQTMAKLTAAVEALIQYLKDQKDGAATVPAGVVRFEIPNLERVPSMVALDEHMLEKLKANAVRTDMVLTARLAEKALKLQTVINKLGSWASAAQDEDSGCCQELKAIFNEVLELAEPTAGSYDLPTNTLADLHDKIDDEMGRYIAGGGLCSEEKCVPGCRGCGDRGATGPVGPGPCPAGEPGPAGVEGRDMCLACGANVPPIIGEGTCQKCDPKGCAENEVRNGTITALDVLRKMDKLISLGDLAYTIRESEAQGWEGPKVVAWGLACAQMRQLFERDDHRHATERDNTCSQAPQNRGIVPWPQHWPPYHHRNDPCDMKVGPCSCGSWHAEGEFKLERDGLGNYYVSRELEQWPADHVGDGYNSHCNCSQCKDTRASVAKRDR